MLNQRKMIFCLGALLIGCSQNPIKNTGNTMASNAQSPDLIGCLLPGQIRRLSGNATYLMPRRPIKTTHADCKNRGGQTI